MSTAYSPSKIQQAKRMQRNGHALLVTCPQPILEYTKRMGGVDRFDRYRAVYSVSHKSRKWWFRIFYFTVDTAIVNAFILYKAVHPESPMLLLDFRVDLFRSLVSGYTSRYRRSSLEGSSFVKYRLQAKARCKMLGVPETIRLQEGDHYPQQTDKFRRCRLCSSRKNNKRSRIICVKCNVALCIAPCFRLFHKH